MNGGEGVCGSKDNWSTPSMPSHQAIKQDIQCKEREHTTEKE